MLERHSKNMPDGTIEFSTQKKQPVPTTTRPCRHYPIQTPQNPLFRTRSVHSYSITWLPQSRPLKLILQKLSVSSQNLKHHSQIPRKIRQHPRKTQFFKNPIFGIMPNKKLTPKNKKPTKKNSLKTLSQAI